MDLLTDVIERRTVNQRINSIKSLPKVDIHRHLEGSLRLSTLVEIARLEDLAMPAEAESLRPRVQIEGESPVDVPAFLDKFKAIRQFFRSREIIQRLVDEVVEDAADDNVQVLELRFTPTALAQAGGFKLEDVTDWVLAAVQSAGTKHSVQVASILSINRHEPIELAEKVTKLAIEAMPSGVTGLDLAGDEANFPAAPFKTLLQQAKSAGLGLTVHAGEWAGAENVREAIETLGVDRIGHGIRVLEDKDITAIAARSGTIFEVSLTSNLKTGVISNQESHPLPEMVQAGLSVALTTDDPSIFDSQLSDEYEIAQKHYGFNDDSLKAFNLTALQAMFLPGREKRRLEKKLVQAYWGMEIDLAPGR